MFWVIGSVSALLSQTRPITHITCYKTTQRNKDETNNKEMEHKYLYIFNVMQLSGFGAPVPLHKTRASPRIRRCIGTGWPSVAIYWCGFYFTYIYIYFFFSLLTAAVVLYNSYTESTSIEMRKILSVMMVVYFAFGRVWCYALEWE